MDDSILNTIKRMLGIPLEYDAFDFELVMFINSALARLRQLGIGPQDEFYKITGENETWKDFFGEKEYPDVQSYVYLRLRLLFDPPQNSFVVSSFKDQAQETEWRLTVFHDEELSESGEEDVVDE